MYHIDRGYEFVENKFMNLGAKIKRVREDENKVIELETRVI